MIMIGSFAIDIGKRCISALSKIFNLCRKTIRKAIQIFKKQIKCKLELETREIYLNFMRNLTWKEIKSVTKLKEVKYEKGLTVEKKEMKELEDKYLFRTEGIKKWSVIITP